MGEDNEKDEVNELKDEIKNLKNDWQKEIIKTQYNKLSNDWTSFNNLIWAVPTVAVAIMSGMLVAAYHPEFDKSPQVRIVILCLGSLFLFALTVEVVKKRYHMNAISLLLKDLQKKLELNETFQFPLGISDDIEKYLKKRVIDENELADNKDPVFKFFKISYARKYLTYVILIAAISMALLAEWEFIKLGKGDYWIGIVIGLGGVIAVVSYNINKYFHEKRKKMSALTEVDKTVLEPANEQTIKITVKDSKSEEPVVGAVIGYPSNLVKLEERITNNEGRFSWTWTVDDTLEVGAYKAAVGVYAKGYKNASATIDFKLEK